MRKLLLGLLIVAVGVVALYRQRLFLWDPLGAVYVDGTKVSGVKVLINYSNDVLFIRDGVPAGMVQGWDRTPGMPRHLTCFRTVACWTERDEAEKIPVAGPGYEPKVTMSNRQVTYTDAAGRGVRVVIR